jgi:hypothetical protein
MQQFGHVLIGSRGIILEADEGFGAMLHEAPDRLRGREVLSITAPADHAECSEALDRLRRTGQAFDIIKRFIRQDRSVLWVRNSVTRMPVGQMDLLVATCAAVAVAPVRQTPAHLLSSARRQLSMIRERSAVCDETFLSGPSWEALLLIYVAEAEGGVVDAEHLATRLGPNSATIGRWLLAMQSAGIVEIETRESRPDAVKSYRLAAETTQRLERYLARFSASAGTELTS